MSRKTKRAKLTAKAMPLVLGVIKTMHSPRGATSEQIMGYLMLCHRKSIAEARTLTCLSLKRGIAFGLIRRHRRNTYKLQDIMLSRTRTKGNCHCGGPSGGKKVLGCRCRGRTGRRKGSKFGLRRRGGRSGSRKGSKFGLRRRGGRSGRRKGSKFGLRRRGGRSGSRKGSNIRLHRVAGKRSLSVKRKCISSTKRRRLVTVRSGRGKPSRRSLRKRSRGGRAKKRSKRSSKSSSKSASKCRTKSGSKSRFRTKSRSKSRSSIRGKSRTRSKVGVKNSGRKAVRKGGVTKRKRSAGRCAPHARKTQRRPSKTTGKCPPCPPSPNAKDYSSARASYRDKVIDCTKPPPVGGKSNSDRADGSNNRVGRRRHYKDAIKKLLARHVKLSRDDLRARASWPETTKRFTEKDDDDDASFYSSTGRCVSGDREDRHASKNVDDEFFSRSRRPNSTTEFGYPEPARNRAETKKPGDDQGCFSSSRGMKGCHRNKREAYRKAIGGLFSRQREARKSSAKSTRSLKQKFRNLFSFKF